MKPSLVDSIQTAISTPQVPSLPRDGNRYLAGALFTEGSSRVIALEGFHCCTLPVFPIFEIRDGKKINRQKNNGAVGGGVSTAVVSERCSQRRLCCGQPSKLAFHLMRAVAMHTQSRYSLPHQQPLLTCPTAYDRILVPTLITSAPTSNLGFRGAAVRGCILVLITLGCHLEQVSAFLAEIFSISVLVRWVPGRVG